MKRFTFFSLLAYLCLTLTLSPMLSAEESEQERKARLQAQNAANRQLWEERTRGENLALGKKTRLVPTPDYRLTIPGGTDETDLTDGKLTTAQNEKLWFDSKCVGWYMGNGVERLIQLDLGSVQPVGKAVIRCLGGTRHNFTYPRRFEVWVSRDGEKYFQASNMEKLMPYEAHQCDWKRFYFVEEENTEWNDTRVYPFQLHVNADARFVLLKVTGMTASVFSDELAVLKAEGEKGPEFNAAYASSGRAFPLEGLIFTTRWNELGIVKGMQLPQHFQYTDLRDKNTENASEPVEMVVEVPIGIEVCAGVPERISPAWANVRGTPFEKVNADGKKEKYQRFVYPIETGKGKLALPRLFFSVEEEPKGGFPSVWICARCGGKDQFRTELPVRVETLPEFEPFRKLHVSLAWMVERDMMFWPNFFENYRRLGFNTVPCFPRHWPKEEGPKLAEYTDFLDQAREEGFKILMNESPLHVMMGGKKEGEELFCQDPKKPSLNLCPSYRGEMYQREMDRVAQGVERSRPDWVFFDIECWHKAAVSAKTCSRCREAFQKAAEGKSAEEFTLEEFLFANGREITMDLKNAVLRGAKAAKIPQPVIGSYGREPIKPRDGIERFNDIFPDTIDFAMPSLYVAGRERDVHSCISENCELLPNRELIPWLSAGTYGEFEPFRLEYMVLESFLNGARGITYFCFKDFDTPLDFYAHAKALALLRPFEDLLADGKRLKIKGSNPNLLYSAFGTETEMLVLVGNPGGADPKTQIRIPLSSETGTFTASDLRKGETAISKDGTLKFRVEKDEIRLFHIRPAESED